MNQYPLGSVWRKWDLHFHTPASFDYQNRSASNEDIVDCLEKSGVSVVAVTDHHVIDVPRIKDMQSLANGKITIFPGIELRSELGGSTSVHYIGIFPQDCDLEDVWTKLQGRLGLTPADVAAKGDDRVYVEFKKGAKAIKELGGHVSVHAGKKSNSIEVISNAEEFKQQFKQDLAKDFVDILEIGKAADDKPYRELVFPLIGKTMPLIVGSDNHNAAQYQARCPCWVKADPNFLGLQQLLHEPEGRIHLGDIPPSVERIRQNTTKYIESVSVSKNAGSPLRETWFSGTQILNPGLVAIIGNKGSGKSALADIIGHLGNTSHAESFSFLNSSKFRSKRENKAAHFEAELKWQSGTTVTKSLNDPHEASAVESVKYLPQRHLETICNEINGPSGSAFERELKGVIFSHVGEAERLGKASLDELIKYKTDETEKAIDLLKADLREINKEIVGLEGRLKVSYRKTLESQRDERVRELTALDTAKPSVVQQPQADPAVCGKNEEITRSIEVKRSLLDKIDAQIATISVQKKAQLKLQSVANNLLTRFDNFYKQSSTFTNASAADARVLSLDIKDLVSIEIKDGPVKKALEGATSTLQGLDEMISPDTATGLPAQRDTIADEVKQLEAKLDEPNKNYQIYVRELEVWESRRTQIIGDAHSVGTISYLESALVSIAEIPIQLEELRASRLSIATNIHAEIAKLAQSYEKLYLPVQKFIATHPLAKNQFDLKFKVSIVNTSFGEKFFDFVGQQKRGSFYGAEEGRRLLNAIIDKADFGMPDGYNKFIESILDHLSTDRREASAAVTDIDDQLRKSILKADFYDFLFSASYLQPRYSLQWSGKEVEQLSPGERGTLLLIFYLLIDNGDIPIVIDQPDDNLDNQTVVQILVPCIKDVKTRRQIIIVTHNPNLAVVCDADQVICASFDKSTSHIKYNSGAIEDPAINKSIIDILEGTRPAFDIRDSKYQEFK